MLSPIQQRYLASERGTITKAAARSVALIYPSPYHVGMSSLGYQQVYRILNGLHNVSAERAFLPDEGEDVRELLTYESGRPAGDFRVLAWSVAYELEITGVFETLKLAGIPYLAADRTDQHPFVVMGGPLTFSNPLPLGPFADAVVMGEAEDLLEPLVETLFSMGRDQALKTLAQIPGIWVPSIHGDVLMPVARAKDAHLPAQSVILTPHTALSDKFLIETERGCSRGCTFCVMRRSTNGGMRLADKDVIVAAVPEAAKKVGLVGAAVSDHPRIAQIVRSLVDSGREVSLSSLRADRLTPEFMQALVDGGAQTLTIASDGASERLRESMEKKIREKHLLRAAEYVRDFGVPQLKNYMMIGVPGETDADLAELAAFTLQQADVAGKHVRVSLGVSTFVAKRNTPLDNAPFIGIREAERRLDTLRRALAPRVEVRPVSARWAQVEYWLAQGGMAAGLLAFSAWEAGATFAAWKRFFAKAKTPAMAEATTTTRAAS